MLLIWFFVCFLDMYHGNFAIKNSTFTMVMKFMVYGTSKNTMVLSWHLQERIVAVPWYLFYNQLVILWSIKIYDGTEIYVSCNILVAPCWTMKIS